MFGSNKNLFDDDAIQREENELRQLLASIGDTPAQGPSDAYWAILPQRIMARISRTQHRAPRTAWTFWWKPGAAFSTAVVIAGAFILLRSTPVSLDQTVGSMTADEVKVLQSTQEDLVPVYSDDAVIDTDIIVQANSAIPSDFDAVLTLSDVNVDQVDDSTNQQMLPLEDQMTIENMNDQETDVLIQQLKTSL